MTRRPVSDECSVLGPHPKHRESERFFTKDLALFLRCRQGDLLKFLRKIRLLRETYPGPCRHALKWTTPRGVAMAVAHFRAIQGRQELGKRG